MARVVIDIPDDNYKRIRELAEVNGLSNNLMGYSLLAIAHGTVLPKGHGELIDRSELKKTIEELAITEEVVDYDCGCASLTGVSQYIDRPDVLDLVDTAPTVIEADKEKADENS